jgi:hypothetical protein
MWCALLCFQRVKWTKAEESLLEKGVREFGHGQWSKIQRKYLADSNRTQVNIKDKYRNMTTERESSVVSKQVRCFCLRLNVALGVNVHKIGLALCSALFPASYCLDESRGEADRERRGRVRTRAMVEDRTQVLCRLEPHTGQHQGQVPEHNRH